MIFSLIWAKLKNSKFLKNMLVPLKNFKFKIPLQKFSSINGSNMSSYEEIFLLKTGHF